MSGLEAHRRFPGRGRPPDPDVRRRVEHATASSLGEVRVHDDAAAQRFVDAEGARALTLGERIALGSSAGDGLERDAVLAHELAHAAQQQGARARQDLGQTDDERGADGVAVAAMLGATAPHRRTGTLALRRCDAPPPAVRKAASSTDPAKLAAFEKMVRGGVPAAEAADSLQLPQELRDAMAEAWKNSFPGAKSKEQGGLLVRQSDGSLSFVKATRTTSGSTTLPWDKVPTGATPIVAGHTHPYDASEGGHQGVTFSGGDLANLVTDVTSVKTVDAGDRYFVVTKTKEFLDMVAAAHDLATLQTQISSEWDAEYKSAAGNLPDRARAATKLIAAKYHLVLYEGALDGSVKKAAP